MISAASIGPTNAGSEPGVAALLPGARLRDYEIIKAIGEGETSIVYQAWDHALQRRVAIKEFRPRGIAARTRGSPGMVVASESDLDLFRAGLRSFVDESRTLARFDHPSLVKVYRFWEEHGTAYMVTPFYEGPTLRSALAALGRVPGEDELRTWLRPVLDAVAALHERGVVHQNIGPEEILLTPTGPVLLGFDAPRKAMASAPRSRASALKPGYAALEQYGDDRSFPRGPNTDLYALAAVVHYAIAGEPPPPADERERSDPLHPLIVVAAGLYGHAFLAATDAALALRPEKRVADHLAWRALLGGMDAPATPIALAPASDPMQEPFASRRSAKAEITVPDRAAGSPSMPAPLEPAPVKARPRTTGAAPLSDAARAATDVASPSWMRNVQLAARAPNRRLLYTAIGGATVVIGAAALILQSKGGAAPDAAVATPSPRLGPSATTAPRPSVVRPAPASIAAPGRAMAGASMPAAPSREARCLDILQRVSIEAITAEDSAFYKQECR